MAKKEAIYIGAIWKNDETEKISGSIKKEELDKVVAETGDDNIYFMVFPNENKTKPTQPDFNVVWYPPKEKKSSYSKKDSGERKTGKKKSSLF